MLLIIGVENAKSDTSTFSMAVPAFQRFGYECVSDADSEEDMLPSIKKAIASSLLQVIDGGHPIDSLGNDYKNLTMYKSDYPQYDDWLMIELRTDTLRQ